MSGRAPDNTAPDTSAAHSAPGFGERRHEPRFPCDTVPARVRIDSEEVPAQILDISRSGIRLEVAACVPVDSQATVYFNNIIAAGRIRYCRRNRKESFDIGLRIEDVIARF